MKGKSNNPQNLKPFKKGVDTRRNTKGAPKKIPNLDAYLAEILESNDGLKKILESMKKQAINGNTRAADLLLDRAYGKAKQIIENEVTVTSNVKMKLPDGMELEL